MSVIGYRIVTACGTIKMDLSEENKVDTTNVDPIRNSAALVDTEDTDVTRGSIKLFTFDSARK